MLDTNCKKERLRIFFEFTSKFIKFINQIKKKGKEIFMVDQQECLRINKNYQIITRKIKENIEKIIKRIQGNGQTNQIYFNITEKGQTNQNTLQHYGNRTN